MTDPILHLENLSLTLPSAGGPVKILRGLGLSVAKGESVAVVGPSGSGKTSLLMILAGLELPSRGRVEAAGCDLARMDEDARARFRGRHVGIVFQAFHLVPTMTALENTSLPLEFTGDSAAGPRARAMLARVGLDHRLHHYPAQLSGGEQQRVALARALAPRPPILLADEPTGNLDRANGGKVADLLFHLQKEEGATLILVTHDPELARRCQRRLAMRDGQIFPS